MPKKKLFFITQFILLTLVISLFFGTSVVATQQKTLHSEDTDGSTLLDVGYSRVSVDAIAYKNTYNPMWFFSTVNVTFNREPTFGNKIGSTYGWLDGLQYKGRDPPERHRYITFLDDTESFSELTDVRSVNLYGDYVYELYAYCKTAFFTPVLQGLSIVWNGPIYRAAYTELYAND